MSLLSFSRLRVRLVLLVLLAVLPALGLLLYSANEQRQQAVAEAQDDALRLARLASTNQEHLIDGTRQLLVVLARLPEVNGGDAASCRSLLAALLARYSLYANLGVIAPDGALVCSAVPTQGRVNLGDRPYFQRAVATRDFALGDYQTGRVTGKATLNCGYPVLDANGRVTAVVYAALDLTWFGRFAAQAQLPAGATLTLLDRHGTVLVRVPDPTHLVGRSLAGLPVTATIIAGRSGVTEARGADGRDDLFAYAPLGDASPTGAFTSVAIPKAVAVAPADHAFRRDVERLALAGLVALAAAWVGADFLMRNDTEAMKTVVRQLYDAVNSGDLAALDDVVAAEFVDHTPEPGQAPGREGFKQAVARFRAAYPDGRITVEELTAEGDRVTARVTLRGTQAAEYFGAPPTGRPVVAEGIEVFHLVGGKIAAGWSLYLEPTTSDAIATPTGAAAPRPDGAAGPGSA
jgi:steroid delta-isomerase-like uncharacterized protein